MVRKIEFQLHERGEMQQAFPKGCQFVRHRTSKLAERQVFLRLGLRGYEVRHRFRLGQIHLAVEESPACKLSRLRSLAARINEPPEQLLLNKETAVTRYLHRVFSCKRMRRPENRTEHLVQGFILPLNPAEMDCSGFRLRQPDTAAEKTVCNRDSLLPGNTNNSYSACSIGG